MFKTHIHSALIIIGLLISAVVLAAPRLTVVVVVDGLRQDNLDQLRPYWQQGGLRTLSEEAYQSTCSFPHLVYGGDETTATIMTGTTPAHHGYAMDNYFLRSDRRVHSLLIDDSQKGIGAALAYSPVALLAPTIGDNLRMRIGDKAKIFAIGIQPETTILMAGHSANACCWINPDKLAWASTSFYPMGLPSAADAMNISGRFAELAEREWTPRMNITSYTSPTAEEIRKPFAYKNADVLINAPVANTLVVELALALQKSEALGVDAVPDILFLQLNTVTPNAQADRIQSAEQEDMHLWLNQDLGYLMEQLIKRLGKQNVEFLVVGRPVLGIGQKTMQSAGLPAKDLNVNRVAALTSTFLMALYGHERWVDGGYGNSIFLNRTLIAQKKISLETMQRQVANFLLDFEGIQAAFPQHEAIVYPDLASSLNKKQTGDVVFTLLPGWRLCENDKNVIDNVIEAQPTAPVMFWSANFLQFPDTPLSATDIINLVK